ncbi:enoyl-CoA hydratase [Actinoplanes sp. SE50]|uniref:type II toxin-antitoxin system Rv0910 family toxin n=1 Tax=unclassified Actinoplanes TaxID=2626549 RepID=UPI00023ECF27|nr:MULTISPECIES: enoyl-CoA hydratase-related protein [unclassified Actinoplanes]AEV86625.1 acetyl-CoA C-acetyltransferase [Actinoplanes sp. SE50/110]ATO85023.1 enoyl-CoA hydratase [Actinoplanes sp. SE50]SLM02433.1 enoyl-CoA hydratase [Actinoplanes sp. SE50/110]
MRFRRRSVPETLPVVVPPRRLSRPWALSVTVPATPERVHAYLTHAATMADWMVMHTGWPADPPGVVHGGSRFRQRVRLMGTPVEVRWTVRDAERPRTLWLDGTGPMGIEVGVYLSLAAGEGGTVVRLDGGVQGGPTDGPLGAMVARSLTDALRTSLRRLTAVDLTATGPVIGGPDDAASGRVRPPEKSGKIRHERTGIDLDPWTPVIVGAGQVSDRSSTDDPVTLAVRALREAATDAGRPGLLPMADTIGWVASVSWQYLSAGALIAEAVGATPTHTVQTSLFGGDGPLRLLNDIAAAITRGETSIALLAGAESAATAAAADRAGHPLNWPRQPDGTAPTRILGSDREPNNTPETDAGLVSPLHLYALIENALRARHGRTPQQHQAVITELWSRFADVAATNPYAWLPGPRTPADLATPGPVNRPVCHPYTKLLTANLQVNQASGLIVCSVRAATEAGIPQDRWVFPHAGAHASDAWFVTERDDLTASPAIGAIGRAILAHTGTTINDIRHIDLYACFPSAVQIAAAELGLPLDDPARPLTVTGGLTFAGGPGNNYAGHSVATLVSRLRADPDGFGLATALGWYLTKHAATILSAHPPRAGFRDIDAGLRLPRALRPAASSGSGGTLEAYTVTYHRDGTPATGIVTELGPDGTRIVRTADPASLLDGDPLRPFPRPAALTPVEVAWHGPVTVIRLNRPEARNVVDPLTARALQRAIGDFEADPDARVAVLTGTGPTFCAGTDPETAALGPIGKPLIAAVEGVAVAGGFALALAADLIVAADDALFGLPEVTEGLVAAGLTRLARRLPRAVALELALTGEPMPARRLHDLGLVNRITAPGKAYGQAIDLAVSIAAHPAAAVLLSQRAVAECGGDDLRRKG